MELKLKIEYQELLSLIRQLSESQLKKLKADIDRVNGQKKSQIKISDFQKLLLSGPVMSDEQYQQYIDNRKKFNQWRTN